MSANNNPGAAVYTQSFGTTSLGALGIIPFISDVDPTNANIQGPFGLFKIGQEWVNTVGNRVWTLTSISSAGGIVTGVWTEASNILSGVQVLTGNSGGAVSPTLGNINITGSGGVTVTGTPGTSTLDITDPTALRTLTGVSGGAVPATTGNITYAAGGGLTIVGNPGTSTITFTQGASGGVTSLAGTANQVAVSAATGAVTLSLPATVIAPGTLASTTALTAGTDFTVSGGLVQINVAGPSGNINIGNAASGAFTNIQTGTGGFLVGGNGNSVSIATDGAPNIVTVGSTTGVAALTLQSGSGNTTIASSGGSILMHANTDFAANKVLMTAGVAGSIVGTTTLVAGSGTATTTAVSAVSKIFLSHANTAGVIGNVYVNVITPGVQFTIASDAATDISDINWLIIN